MMTNRWAPMAAIMGCWLASVPAWAENDTVLKPLERPDPATITLPDMTIKPTKPDPRRSDEYFYFHKSNVSYERAFSDLDQCRMYSQMAQLVAPMPRFIPLGGEQIEPTGPDGWSTFPMFGFAGMMIANWLIAEGQEEMAITTNRRCMAYKGYQRYGISRAIFKQIESGTDTEKLARKARIASGSAPQTEALEP